MSGVVSIELVLDPDTEARVREDWTRLADAGLSSLGLHPAPSNRPHITLLVRPALAPISFSPAVSLLPIPVELAEPVTFTHRGRAVLAWRVTPDDPLRELHRVVHATAPPGDDAPHTAPRDWTPHVTLARRLRIDALPEALAMLGPSCRGTGEELRRWDSATATVTPLT